MKTPRVKDFDPNANVPALKSPLEGMPTIDKPTRPMPQESPVQESEQSDNRSSQAIPERVNARTPERPFGKRIITRNSFEIFEDQMESLRKLSFQEKMEGKLGSMSQMMREAIDDYLKKRSSTK
jgi:hypothetical protein